MKAVTFDDFQVKDSVVVVYTGEGKGKTTAALGLMGRALGNRWQVAFIQFIKDWGVGEHVFIRDIQTIYKDQLYFIKGGQGFFDAPDDLSPKKVTAKQHRQTAQATYREALRCTSSGEFDLVICDEINNAVHDGLLRQNQLEKIIKSHHQRTSLCLTGRYFPTDLLQLTDIATDMHKLKHHFDNKFLANRGIDF